MINASVSAILGIAFAALGTGTVFLMFHCWGYPFDKATRTSDAPRGLMLLHRAMGFGFIGLYVFMMAQMVPRMLHYQVEFPPRTVAHMILAITIGFLLLIKVSILRFFRHLEEWMPVLGTALLLCTYLLVGLSVPFSFRERQLRTRAVGGDVASAQNLERLKRILPSAGLPKEAPLDALVSAKALDAGREVVLTKCVQCHDLKTILTRPRAPKDWVQTVDRMAEKPVLGQPIDEKQQWQAAVYLIAITPELQQSAKKARAQKTEATDARVAAVVAMESPAAAPSDVASMKPLFETKCSECHDLVDCEKHVWKGEADVKDTVERMVDNGLEASPEELEQLRQYLLAVYVPRGGAATNNPDVTSTTTGAAAQPGPTMPDEAKPSEKTGGRKAAPAGALKGPGVAAPPATAVVVEPSDRGPPACGVRPLPDCPMQAWMKAHAASASASEDAPALASVLDRIARLAPPGYASWGPISSDGAAAARAGDVKGARAACSTCHTQLRAKYRAEMRARPVH